MNARDTIDYQTIVESNILIARAFTSANSKISRLPASDLANIDLLNSIVKTEFDNISILLSDKIYESAKNQYYSAIRQNRMLSGRLGHRIGYDFNATDKAMLDIFDDGGSLFISNVYDNNLQGRVVDEMKKMVSEGKSLKDTKDDLGKLLNITGKRALSNLASHVVTNNTWARSIATTNLIERSGAKSYKYLVVLDAKTSAICRELAGKEMPIEKAVKLRDEFINIPRDNYSNFINRLNDVSPTISYDEEKKIFYKQSDADKPYKQIWTKDSIETIPGIELPPLHIRCRTEVGIVY